MEDRIYKFVTLYKCINAGFRAAKSYSDHIFTLRQIIEQSVEWNSALYIKFIDYEKVLDSIH